MTTRMRQTAALGLVAVAAGLGALGTSDAKAEIVTPLPAADYAVQPACKPATAGHATCLALQLVPRTTEARARTRPLGVTRSHAIAADSPKEGGYGLTPGQLHSAYGLPATAVSTQTIALVDAYNDPTAASDLQAYESEFELDSCKETGCFRKVNQEGSEAEASLPFPKTVQDLKQARQHGTKTEREEAEQAEGWDVEISLDIEAARATCQSCHILLVEADSAEDEDLSRAEDWAAEHGGADEISNSWGGPEGESATPFDHPGIVITAAAGDDGYLGWNARNSWERGYASFPASSPDVVAVGGTHLLHNEAGEWQSEKVWNDGGESDGSVDGSGATGGGCSELFTAQAWQQHVPDWKEVGCGTKRAVADVSADGDPFTGFALYDTSPAPEETASHWYTYGGTSLSSPIIAATFALAGGSGGVEYPAQTLYQNEKLLPTSLHDVTASSMTGSNGKCSEPFEAITIGEEQDLASCTSQQEAQASCFGHLSCLAHSGYDGPSGVGTPNGLQAFEPLTAEQSEALDKAEEEEAAAAIRGEEQANAEARIREEQIKAEEETREPEKTGSESQPPSNGPGSGSSGVTIHTDTAPPTTTTTTTSQTPRITGLALTLKAILALNRARPRTSRVAFAFTISVAARVAVRLTKRVRVHGHTRWVSAHRTLTLAAALGRNVDSLVGNGVLGPGAYRLALAPSGGAASSIVFDIG
jgi:hypothetical protein